LPREKRRLVKRYPKGFQADFMMREDVEGVCGEKAAENRRS
jgi:hypothetical protein